MTTASVSAVAAPQRRNELSLFLHQVRFEQLSFWRNPQSAFFTFVFPMVMFAIFGLVFGSSKNFDGQITGLQYYSSTIAAVSVMGACYSQLAIGMAFRRQTGILKRMRATPLPASTYFAGLVAHCIIVSAIEVAIIVGMSAAYGVSLPAQWLPIVVTLVVGAAAFCALGVAVASLVRNAEAAPAVVQFIFFPLLFLSGSYFPIHSSVLNDIANVFPVRPFNQALLAPFALDGGYQWSKIGVLAAWGVAGGIVAIRRFRWDPRPE